MSTYLVAVVIGIFDYYEKQVSIPGCQKKVQVRAVCPVNQKDRGSYAVDIAEKALIFFSKYFNEPYPLDKLDLVGVNVIDCMAEENFGCILFKDDFFFVDAGTTPASRVKRITRLIFHETAHQWFGNLVSISWWKYLWLKESFARFLEYQLVDLHYPEWHFWNDFMTAIYYPAMNSDSLKSSHPVECKELSRGPEIRAIFDVISYGKGASVLRCMANYIGLDLLWKCVSLFIATYRLSSATTEDFWACLEKVTQKKDLSKIFDSWIKVPHFPLLFCSKLPDGKIKITQECIVKGVEEQLYMVPLQFYFHNTVEKKDTFSDFIVLTEKETVLSLPTKGPFLLNFKQMAFLRTNYSKELWEDIH